MDGWLDLFWRNSCPENYPLPSISNEVSFLASFASSRRDLRACNGDQEEPQYRPNAEWVKLQPLARRLFGCDSAGRNAYEQTWLSRSSCLCSRGNCLGELFSRPTAS